MDVSKRQREHRNSAEERMEREEEGGLEPFVSSKMPGEDRIVMLGDGIFAISVTLLVLGIQIPAGVDHAGFIRALTGEFFTNTIFYAITFMVLALYWLNHRQLLNLVVRIDRAFLWLNLLFLAFVAFFPVASSLLRFAQFSEAVVIYTVVLAGCGYSSLLLWIYALGNQRLVVHDLQLNRRSLSRFVGVSIVPTFILLSLLLLYIPYFAAAPSRIFYSWLLLPFVNRLWIWIAKLLRGRRQDRRTAK